MPKQHHKDLLQLVCLLVPACSTHHHYLSYALSNDACTIDIYMTSGLRSVITCNQGMNNRSCHLQFIHSPVTCSVIIITVYEILLEAGYTSTSPDWPTIFKGILPQRWKWKEKSIGDADAAAAKATGSSNDGDAKYADNDDYDNNDDNYDNDDDDYDDDDDHDDTTSETKRVPLAPAVSSGVTSTTDNGEHVGDKRLNPPAVIAPTDHVDEPSLTKRAKIDTT
jgi:hypothetical protein